MCTILQAEEHLMTGVRSCSKTLGLTSSPQDWLEGQARVLFPCQLGVSHSEPSAVLLPLSLINHRICYLHPTATLLRRRKECAIPDHPSCCFILLLNYSQRDREFRMCVHLKCHFPSLKGTSDCILSFLEIFKWFHIVFEFTQCS